MLRLPLWVRPSSRRFHRPMVSIRSYRLNWVASMLLTAMLLALLSSEGWAESIRTAIPQANLNYLSIYVAEARGFFRDEGLENETVVISGPLATAALLSGDVDFSGGVAAACERRSRELRSKAFTFKQRK
jgi:ABC-type nitrate/sulfonate/bicarbonate transport system substrate-binding protein